MTTGLSPLTYRRLQLGAGAFFTDLDYASCADAVALRAALAEAIKDGRKTLGATRGGGTFECVPAVREIEADGKRYGFVGGTVFDGWTVRMTGTLLEITPEHLATVIAAADITGDAARRTIRARTDLLPRDYIKRLVWAGDTSEGLLLIALKNALNTAGAAFTFTDKGEGTLPFEFRAHQDGVEETAYAPFEIVQIGAA